MEKPPANYKTWLSLYMELEKSSADRGEALMDSSVYIPPPVCSALPLYDSRIKQTKIKEIPVGYIKQMAFTEILPFIPTLNEAAEIINNIRRYGISAQFGYVYKDGNLLLEKLYGIIKLLSH